MFEANRFKLQMFGISMCIVVIALASVVTAQHAEAYQYAPPPQSNDFNYDPRYSSTYRGFNSASLSSSQPRNSDVIRFPEMSPAAVVSGSTPDENVYAERIKKNNKNDDERSSHLERSNEVSVLKQFNPLLIFKNNDQIP